MAKKTFKPGQGFGREDWEAVIDNPELTDAELASLRPFAEVFPEFAASIESEGKKQVSLLLSVEVIDHYTAGGADWEARIDADLRRLNNIT